MDNNNNNNKSPLISGRVRRWLVISALMSIAGASLYYTFPGLIDAALKSQLQIKEGNDFTSTWQMNPFPIRFDAYVFSLENPEEFAAGEKPRLKEMGPYTYDFFIYKSIVSFSEDQRKFRFMDSQSFHFNEDLSVGQLSDKVTVLNFPVYAMANLVRTMVGNLPGSFAITPIAMAFANLLFMSHGESLIKETTVEELLNGYPFRILDTIDTLTKPLTWFGLTLPDTGMPDNKFGFLWTKNFTQNGPYDAYTGQGDGPLLRITGFKDKRELDFYPEARCNIINGTEGSTLGVNVQKDQKYYVFTGDTCKTFNVVYKEDTWVNGIPTYRFIPNPNLFAAPRRNPENTCFCTTPENEDMCDGVFDLSRCLGGAPALYSFPHFLHANRAIRNAVDGMNPDPEKHQPFLDVEPWSGGPIKAAEKIQMNAMVKPIPYLGGFRNVREVILPLIWFEKSAVIDEKFTRQIRMGVWPLYGFLFLIYFLLFGGLLLFVTLVAHVVRKRRQQQAVATAMAVARSESKEPLQESFNNQPGHNSPTSPISISQMNSNLVRQQQHQQYQQQYQQQRQHPARPPRQSMQHPNEAVYWRVASGLPSQQVGPVPPRRNTPRSVNTAQRSPQVGPQPSGKANVRPMNAPANAAGPNELYEPSGKASARPKNAPANAADSTELYEPGSNIIPKNFMSNVERLDDYWTSINEAVGNVPPSQQTSQRHRNQEHTQPMTLHQSAEKPQATIERYSWSPPEVITLH